MIYGNYPLFLFPIAYTLILGQSLRRASFSPLNGLATLVGSHHTLWGGCLFLDSLECVYGPLLFLGNKAGPRGPQGILAYLIYLLVGFL